MKAGNDWDRVFVAQFSTPNKVMPEGNKIWVLGDGVESVFTINDNLGHSGYLVEPSAD